jgi:tetratricopeptide (TPR) repeat protein
MKRAMTALAIFFAAAAAPLLAQRFDNVVRADFFAGYQGDAARLARAMDTCEKALAADPKNAAALVWHGGGLYFQSGQKFRAGDWQKGLEMQERGLKEMDDAVALRPDDLQTLIPRGAVLLASAPFLPDPDARPLTEKGIADWERVLELQRGDATPRAVHSRGELLGGLAIGYRLLGNEEKSAAYLKRIVAELPGSPYAERAAGWLEHPASVKKTDRFCIGCHE